MGPDISPLTSSWPEQRPVARARSPRSVTEPRQPKMSRARRPAHCCDRVTRPESVTRDHGMNRTCSHTNNIMLHLFNRKMKIYEISALKKVHCQMLISVQMKFKRQCIIIYITVSWTKAIIKIAQKIPKFDAL